MEQNNIEGHRKRIRQKFIDTDTEGMTDKELLELLLYYSVKRSDTKPVVNSLFEHYGDSLDAILDAGVDELTGIDGVGCSTAKMIALAGEMVKRRRSSDETDEAAENPDLIEMKAFASNLFTGETVPRLDIILFDISRKIINTSTVYRGYDIISEEDVLSFIKNVTAENVGSITLVQYRPKNGYLPDGEDITLLKNAKKAAARLGIELYDFIRVGKNGTLSLANDMDYYKYF